MPALTRSDSLPEQFPMRRNHSQLFMRSAAQQAIDREAKHTSSVRKADVERRLVVVHRYKRWALVPELVLWHSTKRTLACRGYEPEVCGPCVERNAEASVACRDDGVVCPAAHV